MIVGIYLNNNNYKNIDFSRPELGNPGVRGTQFMIWMISYYLNKNYNDLSVVLFANIIYNMPPSLKCVECKDEFEAARLSADYNVDVFILKVTLSTDNDVFKIFEYNSIKCITWSHNFENYKLAEILANNSSVKCNVCVGRQQYERLRDHKVFKKSTYIYNALNFDCYEGYSLPISDKKNIVTYSGALNKAKGFHRLAKNWSKILKKVPDAQLWVVGNGNLGADIKLGNLGLSDKKYEKLISKYLFDKKTKKLFDSVHFLGNMGGDAQRKCMAQTKVGIANPTGYGETFCIVAIEFEAVGVPVVSAATGGLLDTVVSKSDGILVKTDKQLVNAIVNLLIDDDLNQKLGLSGYQKVRKQFDVQTIIREWYALINDVYNDNAITPLYDYNFPNDKFKWIREMNRKFINFTKKEGSIPSLLEVEYTVKSIIKRLFNFFK